MSLSPIRPRDGSKEEKERYKQDLKGMKEKPWEWSHVSPPRPPQINIKIENKDSKSSDVVEHEIAELEKRKDRLWAKMDKMKKHEVVAYAKDIKISFAFKDSKDRLMRKIIKHEFT
mgnify:CR=1 FL=1|jgi:transcriptional regulator of nitric oxide reductase